MDVIDIARETIEGFPSPFVALEWTADHADLRVAWANQPALERFGPDLVDRLLDRDAPFGAMASLVPDVVGGPSGARRIDRALTRNGRIEHLRCTLIPLAGGVGLVVDEITSEVAASADLGAARSRQEHVERAGGIGVWEADLATGSVYCSPQASEIMGVDGGIEQVIDVVHPDDAALLAHVTRRLLEEAGPLRVSHRIVRGDRVRMLDHHVRSIAGPDGRPTRLVGTVIDVTELRALQAKVHHVQQMRTLGEVTGGLVHDFNNVLMVIRGHADVLLARAPSDDNVRRSLEAISRAGERASELTRRLMALGRPGELHPTQVEPTALLDGVCALVRPLLEDDIVLEVDRTAIDLSRGVMADSEQVQQVIMDLVLNARDAGARTIRLGYGTERLLPHDARCASGMLNPGTYGRLIVADDGGGIEEDTLHRVFEPFFTTKDSASGSGLGLANARSFAERSLGGLFAESTPGSGTTMTLLLPLVMAAGAGVDRRRQHPRASHPLVTAGGDAVPAT